MTFQNPIAFLLFTLFIPLFFQFFSKKRGLTFSSLKAIPLEKSLRSRLVLLPKIISLLGLALLIIALARPVKQQGEQREKKEGIILEMVLDRSGSMGISMDKKGSENRLDIVKRVFSNFIEERPDDMIGLITFARYADTLSPLTRSHKILGEFISSINLPTKEEDGTAIGDALALAVARIEVFKSEMSQEVKNPGVIILLTDGQSNAGNTPVKEATALALKKGIKVYTIGFGGGYMQGPFGIMQEIPKEYGVDQKTLQDIADKTGGLFFDAGNERALNNIYDKIDQLEKTDLDESSFKQVDELFYPFLLLGFIFLLLALLLQSTLFFVVEDF